MELGVLDSRGNEYTDPDMLSYVRANMKSIFDFRNDSIEANCINDAETLWGNLWFENECACIFGDTNEGKSTLAFKIACEVACCGIGVTYFDFENMMHQHYRRMWRNFLDLPDKLYPMRFGQKTSLEQMLSTKAILDSIEMEFLDNDSSVIVIDDISFLCQLKTTKKTSLVLKRFRYWLNRYHISILVVAQAMNHRPGTPLTLDHLMGDRQLQYAFDTIISLNHIPRGTQDGPATHYIKQLKARSTQLVVTANKVVTLQLKYYYDEDDIKRGELVLPENCTEIDKEWRLNRVLLRFNIIDVEVNERRLLYLSPGTDESKLMEFITDCYDRGWSIRAIADHTGVSKSTVHRMLAK